MTEYREVVMRRKLQLEAEEWGMQIQSLHAHSLDSMWYDKRPQDTANGKSVMDIIYNSGKITRKFNSGKTIVLQKGMTGKELIDKYGRHTTN